MKSSAEQAPKLREGRGDEGYRARNGDEKQKGKFRRTDLPRNREMMGVKQAGRLIDEVDG